MEISRRELVGLLAGIGIAANQLQAAPDDTEQLRGNERCQYGISYIPPEAYPKAFRPWLLEDLYKTAPHGVEIKTANGQLLTIQALSRWPFASY